MGEKSKKEDKALLVGLTGSIGSGKSTIARLFAAMGVPIYDSDRSAKRLMQNKKSLIAKISTDFGKDVYDKDGLLNRKLLAERVFKDPKLLERLNQLVHPAVAEDFKQWAAENAEQPYLLKEAAILFESKSHKKLDRVICVIAPAELRRMRVMKRDSASLDQIQAREQNQWPEAKKAQLAHYIINNDGQHSIIEQVQGLHKLLSNQKTN